MSSRWSVGEFVAVFVAHHGLKGEARASERRAAVAKAHGRVLEIGSGTGLNRPHFPPPVTMLVGVDVSLRALTVARNTEDRSAAYLPALAAGEALPFAAATFDTVVTTHFLCLVTSPQFVVREIRRVLRPGGQWLFLEHGESSDARVLNWQRKWRHATKLLCGGCEPDRPILSLIHEGGFEVQELATYNRGWPQAVSFTYRGLASPLPESS